MVTPDDLRRLLAHLEARVRMTEGSEVCIEIQTEAEMLALGLHPDAVHQLLSAPWLEEMIAEVRETPDFCEPDDPSERVLQYARDVVAEYIRKRFTL